MRGCQIVSAIAKFLLVRKPLKLITTVWSDIMITSPKSRVLRYRFFYYTTKCLFFKRCKRAPFYGRLLFLEINLDLFAGF